MRGGRLGISGEWGRFLLMFKSTRSAWGRLKTCPSN